MLSVARSTACLQCTLAGASAPPAVAATAPVPRFGRAARRWRRRLAGIAVGAAVALSPLVPGGTAGAAVRPVPDGVPMAVLNPGAGYRLIGSDGGAFAFGRQTFEGSAAESRLSEPIVAAAQTPTGEGYWMVAGDGGVFSFGDAAFLGSLADHNLSSDIVDIAATRSGAGYWMVAADGGVFAFGDASFAGSLAGTELAAPIVGITPAPAGGYWLAAADGGVFAFGGAPFLGGLVDTELRAPITAIEAAPTGLGYWLVGRDGGVFGFGDAPWHGGLADHRLNGRIVGLAATPTGAGYWLAGSDGGVFSFGDATWVGAVERTNRRVVAITGGLGWGPEPAPPPPPAPAAASAPAPAATLIPPSPPVRVAQARPASGQPADGMTGYDISWPQCDGAYPAQPIGFGIVGVTGGRAFRHNRCLADEWRWALEGGLAGVYVNVNFPRSGWELDLGATGPQPECGGHISCIAYNFGYNGVIDAMNYARSQGVSGFPFVWLDVEVLNYWHPNTELNAVVIRGAIDAVRSEGKDVGIYSTDYQWGLIAGSFAPGVPVWAAGAPDLARSPRWCHRAFGGGPVVMVQMLPIQFDENVMCPGAGPVGRYFARP